MEYLGYSIVAGDYDGSVSQSVTVPNDATFCIAYVGGDDSRTFSAVTLGGTSMDDVVAGSGPYGVNRMWSCACTSGSVTFSYTASGSFGDGGAAVLLYFSGVSGIRSSVGEGLSSAGTLTLSSLTTVAGDIVAIVGMDDGYSSPGAINVTVNSQTQIIETSTLNNRDYAAGYLIATGTSTAMQLYGDWPAACAVALMPAAPGTIGQHSFQVFNDDGSESTATTKAALNTNVTLSAGDVAVLRFLIDATGGDPAEKQFRLEYRKKPSGGSFGDWNTITVN